MDKVVRFVKNITILIFIVALGITYYEITDKSSPVTLYLTQTGKFQIDTNIFFYAVAIFFILINVLISVITKLMLQIPLKRISFIPNKDFWFQDEEITQKLYVVFVTWIYGFALIINVFFTFCTVKIWLINRNQGGELWEWGIILLVFVIIKLAWISFIFYRLRLRREDFFRADD